MIALSRNDPRVRRYMFRARNAGRQVVVPSVVVAETFRGGRGQNAPLEHLLSTVSNITPATEQTARAAGALLGAAHSDATIDALVVATAMEMEPAHILTGDPADLRALTPRASRVEIHAL